jgi:DNA end-binding protein Ku
VHFHEVHVKDGARIEHRRICPKEEREVCYEQIVKGYEVAPGEYVVLEMDEIKAAAGDRGKIVHLDEFVEAADIDPVFYDKTGVSGRSNMSKDELVEALAGSGAR